MAGLPCELIIIIAEFLEKEADINAFVKTNGGFYHVLNKYLYQHNKKHRQSSALEWAIKSGNMPTARKSLEYNSHCVHFSRTSYLLGLAIDYERKELVEPLLVQEIDFTVPDSTLCSGLHVLGTSLLCKAVDNDDPALFHALLDRVSDVLLEPDTPPDERRLECFVERTIEHIVGAHNVPFLKALSKRGFKISITGKALIDAAKNKAMFDFLVSCGIDYEPYLLEAFWVLKEGMSHGNTSAMEYVFEQYSRNDSWRGRRDVTLPDMEPFFGRGYWDEWYNHDENKMLITVQHLLNNRGADPNTKTSRWAYNAFKDAQCCKA